MKRALLISYHLQPDPLVGGLRPASFVRTLRQAEWDVVVVARLVPGAREFWSYDAGVVLYNVGDTPKPSNALVRWARRLRKQPVPEPAAVSAVTYTTASADETLLQRFRRYFRALSTFIDQYKLWSTIAFLRCLPVVFLGEQFDLIVSSGPPMSPHIAASLLAFISGVPHVVDLRDPWITSGAVASEARIQCLERLQNYGLTRCIRHARAVVTASPGIARAVKAVAAKPDPFVHVVLNGFERELRFPQAQASGQLRLLYAGTLYLNRNPFPLLELVDELIASREIDPTRISLIFVGETASWGGVSLLAWAKGRCVEAVLTVLEAVPRERLSIMMDSANVLINFAQGQPLQIPAKTFEYLGSGMEMLVLTESDSDTAQVVREAQAGVCLDASRREEAMQIMLDLYHRYAVRQQPYGFDPDTRKPFSRAAQNARFLELVRSITQDVRAT